MLSTAELDKRPSRPANLAAENEALIALAQTLATAPETILQKLADTALVLCRAHSAGLSLLEEPDQKRQFHWRAIAGEWAAYRDGGTLREFGPCGTVLDRNTAKDRAGIRRSFVPSWSPLPQPRSAGTKGLRYWLSRATATPLEQAYREQEAGGSLADWPDSSTLALTGRDP